MPLTDYRVLSFACFGTLIDRDSGIVAALRPLVRRSGRTVRRADLLEAFGRHEAAALDARRCGSYLDVLADAHARMAREWGAPCPEAEHRLFASAVTDWPAFPDAAGSLQYLKRYFRLAVLSNADRETIRTVSRRLDVSFDVVCSAQDHGAFKPDGRLFEALVARIGRLGATPQQSLHVAASLPHDLAPAAAAGLACAWLDRDATARRTKAPPERFDYVFRSLAHLVREHQEHLRS